VEWGYASWRGAGPQHPALGSDRRAAGRLCRTALANSRRFRRDDAAAVVALGTRDDTPLSRCAPVWPPAWCCSPPPRSAGQLPGHRALEIPATEKPCARTSSAIRLPADALRVGWAPSTPTRASTPRLPVSDVAEWRPADAAQIGCENRGLRRFP
jgi:hypothetical protein